MNTSNKNFDRIERYLFDAMPAEERSSFEYEIVQDQTLAQEVDLHRIEHGVMQHMLREDLKANLQQWRQERQQPKFGVWKNWKTIMSAAAVMMVAAFFWWTMQPNQLTADGMLPEEYATARSKGSAEQTSIDVATEDMKNGRYEAALSKLSLSNDPTYASTIHLLRGKCFFRLNRLAEAEAEFTETAKSNDLLKRDEARFCLMLTAWKQGNLDQARSIRNQLLGQPNAFKAKAETLKDAF